MTGKVDIEKFLLSVAKPSRYTGGEYNSPVYKPEAALDYLMCFPDVYEVAMSNLGIKILQGALNARPDTNCERCFAPWPDMGAAMKANNTPLFSLETRRPAAAFDIMGFSLQYELSYTNVLYMLDLAGAPFLRAEREGGDFPLLMAGGPCAVNPLPVSDIFDIFVIGDGEEAITELAALYIVQKKKLKGAGRAAVNKAFLKAASGVPGVYIPAEGTEKKVVRRILPDLNKAFFPKDLIVPNIEAVHDRAVVEVFRGCSRGCRFCQAGFIYRPVRNRDESLCKAIIEETVEKTGFDEVTLSSLSTGDYPRLPQLIAGLQDMLREKRVNLALPSQRLDSFESDLNLGAKRSGSLTFAPEAGTQRLRNVINKNITDEHIESAVTAAFRQGFSTIKLYFMLGLPTETDEDIQGIADVCRKIKGLYYKHRTAKKGLSLSASCSVFIPKPFTPFQWEAQITPETATARQKFLKYELGKSGIAFHYHDMTVSRLEAAFSRGDKRLSSALIRAYNSGCMFDGWSELFDYDKWTEAFKGAGLEIEEYSGAADHSKPLPWEFIDIGVTREFFVSEREKAYAAAVTPDCRISCGGCGIAARVPECNGGV